jgi:hypothetical protein
MSPPDLSVAALDFKCRHFHQHSAGEMGQDFQKQTPTTNLLSRAQHIPSIQEDVAGGEKNKEKKDREKQTERRAITWTTGLEQRRGGQM